MSSPRQLGRLSCLNADPVKTRWRGQTCAEGCIWIQNPSPSDTYRMLALNGQDTNFTKLSLAFDSEAGERSSGLINRDTETQHCIIHTYGSSLAGKERCGNSSDPQIALQLESNRCLFIYRRMKDGTNSDEFMVWSKVQFRTRDVPWQ